MGKWGMANGNVEEQNESHNLVPAPADKGEKS